MNPYFSVVDNKYVKDDTTLIEWEWGTFTLKLLTCKNVHQAMLDCISSVLAYANNKKMTRYYPNKVFDDDELKDMKKYSLLVSMAYSTSDDGPVTYTTEPLMVLALNTKYVKEKINIPLVSGEFVEFMLGDEVCLCQSSKCFCDLVYRVGKDIRYRVSRHSNGDQRDSKEMAERFERWYTDIAYGKGNPNTYEDRQTSYKYVADNYDQRVVDIEAIILSSGKTKFFFPSDGAGVGDYVARKHKMVSFSSDPSASMVSHAKEKGNNVIMGDNSVFLEKVTDHCVFISHFLKFDKTFLEKCIARKLDIIVFEAASGYPGYSSLYEIHPNVYSSFLFKMLHGISYDSLTVKETRWIQLCRYDKIYINDLSLVRHLSALHILDSPTIVTSMSTKVLEMCRQKGYSVEEGRSGVCVYYDRTTEFHPLYFNLKYGVEHGPLSWISLMDKVFVCRDRGGDIEVHGHRYRVESYPRVVRFVDGDYQKVYHVTRGVKTDDFDFASDSYYTYVEKLDRKVYPTLEPPDDEFPVPTWSYWSIHCEDSFFRKVCNKFDSLQLTPPNDLRSAGHGTYIADWGDVSVSFTSSDIVVCKGRRKEIYSYEKWDDVIGSISEVLELLKKVH